MQGIFYVDDAVGGSMMDKTTFEARTLLAKLSGCPDEASESAMSTCSELQPIQVYSELSIPINLFEVQMDLKAVDLLKIEPINHALNTKFLIPVNTHILNTALSIEHIDIFLGPSDTLTDFDIVLLDDSPSKCLDASTELLYTGEVVSEEPEQVYSKLELHIGLAEV
ncbi:hypothetical protein LR48_Vigan833s001200 [Vigna angularis]|uniref:Uncharacterized protein n=2 Tax=Phaseolus angularis TaxID=3914 RepID=A0A0L9TH72_PHAAN|nr:hypothetical protein LR48_Vigan833s001200 [Vigna angularis]BAT74762.1 hypothetical protein VIGAN_01251000 [Vigna angularis var. angularis]